VFDGKSRLGRLHLTVVPQDGCLLRADGWMLTRLASSGVLRADALTLEASMEMAGELAGAVNAGRWISLSMRRGRAGAGC
jgi:hypothetical protein